MGPTSCPQCGHPLAAASRFCSQCGTPVAAAPPDPLLATVPDPPAAPAVAPKRAGAPDLNKTIVDPAPPVTAPNRPPSRAAATMIGFAASGEALAAMKGWAPPPSAAAAQAPAPSTAAPSTTPGLPPAAPPAPGIALAAGNAAAAGAANPSVASVKRTIVGGSASEFLGAARAPAAASAAGPPNPRTAAAAAAPDPRKGTMMGVAIPGVAPLAPHASPAAARPAHGTMMGVAVPGIAPTHDAAAPGPPRSSAAPSAARVAPRRAVEIAPMPPPLAEEPELGPPPQLVKKGLPVALVAGVIGVLVAIAGVVALLWFKSPPLVAQPRIDAQGHDQLHLRCESCQDGTRAELYDARASFQNKEADLTLTTALKVGNNPLTIVLDRPNLGRDESVQVVVPIAFRIHTDLGELSAARPAITVRVEALPGTDVRIDGKPLALDGSGEGAYAIDIGGETDGPAEETRLIDRIIPYVVTPRGGGAQSGKLAVRVGIAPLRVDAPAHGAVVEGPTFRVAGRTARGASVTANGTALHVEGDGTFAQPLDIAAVGELPLELRATAPQLAPRTARWVVKRVEHLTDEAKARESAPEATYDAIAGDLKAAVGKATIVEGDVVEVRASATQTIAVVDDARGCSTPPCLVRVVYGGDTRFKHGDVLRAYGRVTRSVPYGAGTVPEVEADFVLLGRAPKR